MIKIVFLFLFVVFANSSELVKLHINKNHALITFVESLCDTRYASKIPKRIYLNKTTKDKKLISSLKKIHRKLSRTSISKHKQTRNLLEALYIESLKSVSLKELEFRIASYRTGLKRSDLKRYFNYLYKIMPIYEKIIWDKDYKKLVQKKEQIVKLMDKYNFDNLIKKVAIFYDVDINDIGNIDVAFYPISKGNNINAYRIKNLETIGVLVNKKQNLKWLLTATVLHEISHTIYFKSKIVKKNFNIKNKKKRLNIIEGFATTIGAGWGYKQLTGKLINIKWYNNKAYDKFAKTIYKDIEKYLNNNKKLDKRLIKKAYSLL